MIIPF